MEPGACAGGVTEAAINLQVSKILARMLEKAGHKVKLTREDDVEDAELDWRVELACVVFTRSSRPSSTRSTRAALARASRPSGLRFSRFRLSRSGA